MRILGFTTPAPKQWRGLLQVIPWMDCDDPITVKTEDVAVTARVIHRNLRENFQYLSDYGSDKWELPRLREDGKCYVGDCEDFVAKSFEMLVNEGVPVGALRFAMCRVETGEGHMVGVITTNEGLLVIDQRRQSVEFSDHKFFSGYRWLKVSVPGSNRWQMCV